jgi:O-antigen/teichoic acid export membrane protein
LNGATTLGISLYSVRILDPSGYGILSFCTNWLVLFDALFGSALDLGVARWVTGGEDRVTSRISLVEKAAVYLKLAMGAVLLLVAAAAGEALGFLFFRQPGGRFIFTVLAAAGAGLLLLRSVQVYLQMRLRFGQFGLTDLLHSMLRIALVGTMLAIGNRTATAFLVCFTAAPLIVLAAFTAGLRGTIRWTEAAVRKRDFADVGAASRPALATYGISSLVARMDLFFLAFRTGPVQLGLYGAGLTIATIPEILGAYIAPVFLPRILPACRTGEFYRLFRRFHAVAYTCCGLALAAGLLLAGPVLSRLLPPKYSTSVAVAQILLPGTLAVASVFPLTLNFLMLKRPLAFLTIDLIAAPFLALAYLMVPPTSAPLPAACITSIFRLAKSLTAQVVAYRAARMESVPRQTLGAAAPTTNAPGLTMKVDTGQP